MKRKWWIIATATIAGCIGLAFVVPALRPWRPGVTEENFDRIKIGMAYDEVVAILGSPTDVFPRFGPLLLLGPPQSAERIWIWENDRADEAQIHFD